MRRVMKHHTIFLIDDRLICKLLSDLTIYEYLPSLEPLKADVLRLSAKVKQIKETMRVGLHDKVRPDYEAVVCKFYQLFKHDDYDKLRLFLRERKLIDAQSLVFSQSPY